ncbi:E3 ubiquitin-protein ligase [Tetrabaena socialis]|uniref:E3 ubiquitin-protein ligase n=1 Tax=Tetrabaena socialis TaxID=47790 RepID=A0A2J7ZSY1_9CHLO|nr:E3 ubiquitin-protein ligase [Tetrabaena socialis]|eukprot:PNH03383.1 E3 ubiquitin-protein ligase [Tetrabaena socialis]
MPSQTAGTGPMLDGVIVWSWWAVFSPTIVNHVFHIPMQIAVLMAAAATAAPAAAATPAPAAEDPESGEEGLCVICYDQEATCVFLECGHGGFCRRCAYLLFIRPPNECPSCRSTIEQVVEIEAVAPVGAVALIK